MSGACARALSKSELVNRHKCEDIGQGCGASDYHACQPNFGSPCRHSFIAAFTIGDPIKELNWTPGVEFYPCGCPAPAAWPVAGPVQAISYLRPVVDDGSGLKRMDVLGEGPITGIAVKAMVLVGLNAPLVKPMVTQRSDSSQRVDVLPLWQRVERVSKWLGTAVERALTPEETTEQEMVQVEVAEGTVNDLQYRMNAFRSPLAQTVGETCLLCLDDVISDIVVNGAIPYLLLNGASKLRSHKARDVLGLLLALRTVDVFLGGCPDGLTNGQGACVCIAGYSVSKRFHCTPCEMETCKQATGPHAHSICTSSSFIPSNRGRVCGVSPLVLVLCGLGNETFTSLEGTLSDGPGYSDYDSYLKVSWVIAAPANTVTSQPLVIPCTKFEVGTGHAFLKGYSRQSQACQRQGLVAADQEISTVSLPSPIAAKLVFTSGSEAEAGGLSVSWQVQCAMGYTNHRQVGPRTPGAPGEVKFAQGTGPCPLSGVAQNPARYTCLARVAGIYQPASGATESITCPEDSCSTSPAESQGQTPCGILCKPSYSDLLGGPCTPYELGTDKQSAGTGECLACLSAQPNTKVFLDMGEVLLLLGLVWQLIASVMHLVLVVLDVKRKRKDGASNSHPAARYLLFMALCFIAPGVGRAHCGLSNETFTSLEGTLSDGSKNDVYANNLDCSWIIAPPGNGPLIITFSQLDVEAGCDFVRVYSCESQLCQQPELIANVLEIGTVVSPTGKAKIAFTSDGGLQMDGFTATWRVCSPPLPENSTFVGFSASSNNVPPGCLWSCNANFYESAAGCSACPANSVSPVGSFLSINCTCNSWYTGPDGGPCTACEVGTYKDTVGPQPCYVCQEIDTSNYTDEWIFLSPKDDWKAGIQNAPNGSTVALYAGIYTGSCNVVLQHNIHLQSVCGKSATIVDCQQRKRHFHIKGATVRIHGLTLMSGNSGSDSGGCILINEHANVTISDSILVGSFTSSNGGAIMTQNSSLLLSENTELRTNIAEGHGGGICLHDFSSLTAEKNVLILGNQAGVDGGGIYGSSSSMIKLADGVEVKDCVAGGDGGGVCVDFGILMAERGVSFVGNKATFGGGIYGGVSSVIELADGVEVKDCVAGRAGGGVSIYSGSTLRAVRRVSFVGNEAAAFGGGIDGSYSSVIELADGVAVKDCVAGGEGGGVRIYSASTLRAERNVSFVGNQAAYHGGGIHSSFSSVVELADGVEVKDCVAGGDGGGVLIFSISTLRAERGVSFVGNAANWGGGIYCAYFSLIELAERVEVKYCVAGDGGGGVTIEYGSTLRAERNVSFVGNEAANFGGGIEGEHSSAIELADGVEVKDCVSRKFGGGIFLNFVSFLRAEGNVLFVGNEATMGGGILGSTSSVIELADTVEIRDCVGESGGGIFLINASTLRAERGVSFVGNDAVNFGGGIFGRESSIIKLADGVEVKNCVAGMGGGGVYIDSQSILRAERRISIEDNGAADDGGGIYCSDSSVVELAYRVEVKNCSAGCAGGGIFARECTINAVHFNSSFNMAHAGGSLYSRSSNLKIESSTFQGGHSSKDGGCLLIDGQSALFAYNTTVVECISGGKGGALAMLGLSTATLKGTMMLARNEAEEGGAIFSSGFETQYNGAGVLDIRGNKATIRGGGILSLSSFRVRSGSMLLSDNHAAIGGGWCGVSHESVLTLGAVVTMVVEKCSAGLDGGGIALLDLAGVSFVRKSPCPSQCQGRSSCSTTGACLNTACNFNGDACKWKFENAGQDALHACNRTTCPVWKERYASECGGPSDELNYAVGDCLVASCDWAERSPRCRSVLIELGSCPLFDAVAYDSMISQGSQLTFVEGGTANGFGRCKNSTCHVAQEGTDAYNWCETAKQGTDACEWCETIDDSGRIVSDPDIGDEEVEDIGPAWGVCSKGRPRLPSAGFDYDAVFLRQVLETPVEDIIQQYPGCGHNPIRLVSNTADRMGGGLYSSGCYELKESRGLCFIGDVEIGNEPSLMVLLQNNTAAVGGGIFSECKQFGLCGDLMNKTLGFPSRNKAYSSILEFRDNHAKLYGARAASGALKLSAESNQIVSELVPGHGILDFTVLLHDSFDQAVDGGAKEHIIEITVCAGSETVGSCSNSLSLQPVTFLLYSSAKLHTAEHNTLLQYCAVGSKSVRVHFSLSIDRSLAATVEVRCLPCQSGQTLKHSQKNARDVWTCERCSAGEYGEYIIDPNSHVCQDCPKGASCNGSGLVGRVEGSKWVPDTELGIYRLTRCPRGYGIENKTSEGVFDQQVQQCMQCAAGSECVELQCFECAPCQPGHFKSHIGTAGCEACPKDTYRVLGGASELAACLACPVESETNTLLGQASKDACRCKSGYYSGRTGDCKQCPLLAVEECPYNTSLEKLPLKPNVWRASLFTTKVYPCYLDASDESTCVGSNPTLGERRSGTEEPNRYCAVGHRGPLCAICLDQTKYFSLATANCQACSLSFRFTVAASVILGSLALLVLCYLAAQRKSGLLERMGHHTHSVLRHNTMQAKFKTVISFVQVFNTFSEVYGVRLERNFTRWLQILSIMNLDPSVLIIPGSCVGSIRARLVLSAFAPYAVALLVILAISAHGLFTYSGARRASMVSDLFHRSLYAFIFIFYLVLPSVSRSIFMAKQCQSFETHDSDNTDNAGNAGKRQSYLLADLEIRCSSDSGPEYSRLLSEFWVYFVLWPILVPLSFLLLTLRIRSSVREQHITKLANACRFLWRDYNPTFLYWEVVDMLRKLLLTSMILFVDTENGSSTLLRLVIASIISATYLVLLPLARPFKYSDDLYLACASNLLLVCCFILGIAIKLCEEGLWTDTCTQFLGLTGPYQTNVVVVICTIVVLILSLLGFFSKAFDTVRTQTIQVVSSGRKPILELPEGCNFHCFLSHTWRTGQDQTHTMARQLQLLLPDLKIWLDVDNLDDVGRLEMSVADSAVFIIFLSVGYFRSANCRRELYSAIMQDKQIVTVREMDPDKGGASLEELKKECIRCCVETDGTPLTTEVLRRVFAQDPIAWARVRDFQLESLKLIFLRMLQHLPSYMRNSNELAMGLKIPGELGPCGFLSPVTLLVCAANSNAPSVAEELQAASGEAAGAVRISLLGTQSLLQAEAPPPSEGKTVLLVYLNEQIFLDPDSSMCDLIKRAIDRHMPIALVHEQDTEKGGCPFSTILDQTPQELRLLPYTIFDNLAVPLYSSEEHRRISLWHILRSVGAGPLRALQVLRINPLPSADYAEAPDRANDSDVCFLHSGQLIVTTAAEGLPAEESGVDVTSSMPSAESLQETMQSMHIL